MKILSMVIFTIIILISCKSPYCTEIDKTPCSNLCDQAERLVLKLLEYPDDRICILENEKCIDCNYYLQSYYKQNEGNRKFDDRIFRTYVNKNRKITSCIRIPREELFNPQRDTDFGIIIVIIRSCEPSYFNSWRDSYLQEYDIIFNIINENKLELIYDGPNPGD